MEGRPDPPSLRGVIPNSFQHIFDYVSNSRDAQYLVRASYLEIYNEEIRDLLSKDPKNSLELKENVDSGVYVKDLTSFVVKNVAGKIANTSLSLILPWVFLALCCMLPCCLSLLRNRPCDASRKEESFSW
jgi:hypothetical protein